MRSRIRRWTHKVLLIITLVCLFLAGKTYSEAVKNRQEQEKLRDLVNMDRPREKAALPQEETIGEETREASLDETEEQEIPVAELTQDPVEELQILAKYAELYQANNDLVGWLSIEGMVIDYPVMRSEDDEFYLHHNFQGEEDKYGCLYVRNRADVDTPGTNFIIYGHNMKDGSMFGDLDLYRKRSFCEEHKEISFDTLYEERSYEIVSVFLSQVYADQDQVFKYYQFYDAETEEDFQYFYKNIKELALYDTGVTAEYGDTFLTLSTCAYHVTDGRLVVVAKRIS